MDDGSILNMFLGLNQSRTFAGIAMIIMNIGARYVATDLTKFHEKVLSSTVAKRVILFCIFFIGTRDIMTAIILTFVFTVFLHGLLNETSHWNIIPEYWTEKVESKETPEQVKARKDAEYKQALFVVRQYEMESGGDSGAKPQTTSRTTNMNSESYNSEDLMAMKMRNRALNIVTSFATL